jgi:sugar/nucleoside kinase (ribokinase family)
MDVRGDKFILAAYPSMDVIDPTGAGDSFAGGFMGYLAKQNSIDTTTLKKAIAYGTVVASFTISGFSLDGLTSINSDSIEKRLENLRHITSF